MVELPGDVMSTLAVKVQPSILGRRGGGLSIPLAGPPGGRGYDLGGRSLTLHPLSGHTPSDLAVDVDDQPVVFAGDLLWGGMFPNFVDAIPYSETRRFVREVLMNYDSYQRLYAAP